MNSFGTLFRLTTFGESHGAAMGGVIDGCPAGLRLDLEEIQKEVDRRRPGTSALTTARRESDTVEWLSGISPEGLTLGSPIGFIIRNSDQRSGDYEALRDTFRPNHADLTYHLKYGLRDHRGGGRASARETVCRVAAGAVARQFIAARGVAVRAGIAAVGPVTVEDPFLLPPGEVDPQVADYVALMRREHDSVGGIVAGSITGLPAGLGEPVGDKFHARLGAAMLSINACMGFEYGEGFAAALRRGSEMADEIVPLTDGKLTTLTNHCGGVNGGITNGNEVTFRAAFKPTPTIARPLRSVNVSGQPMTVDARGRHDPCVVIRAVPVVEAMACLTVADMLLLSRL